MDSSRRPVSGQGSGGFSRRPMTTARNGGRGNYVLEVQGAGISKHCEDDISILTKQKERRDRRSFNKERTQQQPTQHLLRSQARDHKAPTRRRCGYLTPTFLSSHALALWSLLLVMAYCSSAKAQDVTGQFYNVLLARLEQIL